MTGHADGDSFQHLPRVLSRERRRGVRERSRLLGLPLRRRGDRERLSRPLSLRPAISSNFRLINSKKKIQLLCMRSSSQITLQ